MTAIRITMAGAAALALVAVFAGGPGVLAAPPNDNLSAATAVSIPGGAANIDTTTATTELGEPAPSCVGSGSHTIWFKMQAAQTQSLTADTAFSNIDTVLAVYTGPPNTSSFASLVPFACNDNFQSSPASRLVLNVTAGTWYYFQIAQVGAVTGTVSFRIDVTLPNDDFAGAITLTTPQSPGPVATVGNTWMATTEPGENIPSCKSGTTAASVWYKWTSPNAAGHALFDTLGSGYDTVISIYTGTGFPLTEVWCNDSWIGSSLALVNYTAATTYYIQVSGQCMGFDCFTGLGLFGELFLNMSMGSILFVDNAGDSNTSDSDLTLREAMLLSQGTLGRSPTSGEDFLFTNYGISAGGAAGDLIQTYFPCSGLGCIPGYTTLSLGSALPTLAGSGDVIDGGYGLDLMADGQNLGFRCFNISGSNNRIEGMAIKRCAQPPNGATQAGIYVTGSNNVIGGPTAFDQNTIFSNYAGVWLVAPGTGNRVIGNQIGLDILGSTAANAVGVYLSGSGNFVGGTVPGEGNVLSGNTYHGVYAFSSGQNTILGNLIGTSPTGTTSVPNGLTGIWLDNATGNTIGGSAPGARNVISGNSGPGVWISEQQPFVPPTFLFSGTAMVPIFVNAGGTLGDLNVTLDISHATDGDLSISLQSPIGTIVDLSSGNGGTGDNYTNTTFDDEASTAITAGSPPFTGSFRPEVALSAFDGQQRNGMWTLRIQNSGFTSGMLNSASLDFAPPGGVNNIVAGNYVGTDITGTAALPNTAGVKINNSEDNVIGGSAAGAGNLISGNSGNGVLIDEPNGSSRTKDNKVQGNLIGTQAGGTASLGNGGSGVMLDNRSMNITVGGTAPGEGNTIAFNALDGVRVNGANSSGHTIRGNSIHSNLGLGIENVNGGNGEPGHAPPVITAAGSASGTACANCTIDVYTDGANEGKVYHGSAVADGGGNWSFPGPVGHSNVTATATNAGGSTSEFSAPFLCSDVDIDGLCTWEDNEDDGDGYTDVVESGAPLCVNGVNDDAFDAGGTDTAVDDGCPGGPAQVGSFSEGQFKIGTGSLDQCGYDGWPSDVYSSGASLNKLDIQDVVSFVTGTIANPVRHLDSSPPSGKYDARWDLSPGRGAFANWINIGDITTLFAGPPGSPAYPAMFPGFRAFGRTCPSPP